MWSTFQQRQSELQLVINEQERLLRKQRSLETDIVNQRQERDELKSELTQEQMDVSKLDGFSFSNMVLKWKGTREEIRDKEEAEAATTELKWNEAVKMVRDLELGLEAVNKELMDEKYQQVHAQWQRLMNEKEAWLRNHSPQNQTVMEELYSRKTVVQTMLKEITEARNAGTAANRFLSTAIEQLASAKSFSTWDTFLGGGLIVTAMKHNAIDNSEDTIHQAQMALRRFQTEVKDVQALEAQSFVVERGEFIKMADFFFDDIFSEWTIHSRIKKSQDNLQNTVNDVLNVLRTLEAKQHVLETELKKIDVKRKQLIEA